MKMYRNWILGILAIFLTFNKSYSQTQVSYDPLGRVTEIAYDNGTTINYSYDAAGNRTQQTITNATPLPVEWLYFKASIPNEDQYHSLLEWATAIEVNSSHFEIQYSKNSRDFIVLDTVLAANNSSTEKYYQFIHEGATQGANYYRLKQIDLDGEYEFSKLVQLIFNQDPNFKVTIYPNPTYTNTFNLEVSGGNVIESVQIYDANGSQIKMTNIRKDSDRFWSLVLEGVSKGTYFTKIITALGVASKTVIVN